MYCLPVIIPAGKNGIYLAVWQNEKEIQGNILISKLSDSRTKGAYSPNRWTIGLHSMKPDGFQVESYSTCCSVPLF
jgi:hypothetical protein